MSDNSVSGVSIDSSKFDPALIVEPSTSTLRRVYVHHGLAAAKHVWERVVVAAGGDAPSSEVIDQMAACYLAEKQEQRARQQAFLDASEICYEPPYPDDFD